MIHLQTALPRRVLPLFLGGGFALVIGVALVFAGGDDAGDLYGEALNSPVPAEPTISAAGASPDTASAPDSGPVLATDVHSYAIAAMAAWAAYDAEALEQLAAGRATETLLGYEGPVGRYDWAYRGCSELDGYWVCWFDSGTGDSLALRIDGARVSEGGTDAIFEAAFV